MDNIEICHHELFDLSFSFNSMHCKKCRAKFIVPDWFRVFAYASQQRTEQVEDHVERIVEGMIQIDLLPCEKCGTFFKSKSAQGLDAPNIAAVCVECLPEWFETHDEEDTPKAETALINWYMRRRDAVKKADPRTAFWINKTYAPEIQQRIARA